MGRGELSRYRSALDYLFARTTGPFRFGLERTVELLRQLGDPHRAVPAFHVAGTNGKGSSVATADALLTARGLRVGRYTSPHLVDFRERIVVGGRPIPEDAVVAFIDRWLPTVEAIGASFFEATTAMAFAHFAEAGADVAVIETGLGGRLDATNVLEAPLAAGVTGIGLDHAEYLGRTLEGIALEKAGIFKPGRPAVVGEPVDGLRSVLERAARDRGAEPVRTVTGEVEPRYVEALPTGTAMTLTGPVGRDRRVVTGLRGAHQAMNTAFALLLLESAGPRWAPDDATVAATLPGVRVPGRFDRRGQWLFDVAHNPAGARVLADALAADALARPIVAVVAILGDKDWEGILGTLAPAVDEFILTTAPSAPAGRAWSLPAVTAWAAERGIVARGVGDLQAALGEGAAAGATTLVTGSFHTVGDAMAMLGISPYEEHSGAT